ncbi:aminoglycoside phosphotransferase family protein [Leifsonia bigeumensis]|uniref:Aminoglycoside phosphotransferase family protein n=2 Tax=Leifsonella bigeumensis TaxID=433643 RepID=A0ABP7FHK8_9MICO
MTHSSNPSGWQDVAASMPQFDWASSTITQGAFHDVAILGTSEVVRLCRGVGHLDRAQRELRTLAAVPSAGLSFAVPCAVGELATTATWSAYATTFVPGHARLDIPWAEALEPLETVLADLGRLPTDELKAVRQWCGGDEWPDKVGQILSNTEQSVRRSAKDVVARLLDIESTAPRTFVHGDFNLYNILFLEGRVSAIIDFDSAGLGDPAADLAPLIGVFGSEHLRDIADADTVQRARAHRATLPLQVAVAADLVGDLNLRDHAIRNFSDRLASGTLEQPDLSRQRPAVAAPRRPWSG